MVKEPNEGGKVVEGRRKEKQQLGGNSSVKDTGVGIERIGGRSEYFICLGKFSNIKKKTYLFQ